MHDYDTVLKLLLSLLAGGELLHIELQSSNDPQDGFAHGRILAGVYQVFKRFRIQIVLYVGNDAVNMPAN